MHKYICWKFAMHLYIFFCKYVHCVISYYMNAVEYTMIQKYSSYVSYTNDDDDDVHLIIIIAMINWSEMWWWYWNCMFHWTRKMFSSFIIISQESKVEKWDSTIVRYFHIYFMYNDRVSLIKFTQLQLHIAFTRCVKFVFSSNQAVFRMFSLYMNM